MERNLESVVRDLETTRRRILVLETLLLSPVACRVNYDNQRRWEGELETLKRLKKMLEVEQQLLVNRR